MPKDFGARKVPYDGYVFDSQQEYERYRELRLMEFAGLVSGITVHPEFQLQPGWKKSNPIMFTADFRYREEETGLIVVEDVKPHKWSKGKNRKRIPFVTPEFSIRWRIVQYQNQDIDFRMVE